MVAMSDQQTFTIDAKGRVIAPTIHASLEARIADLEARLFQVRRETTYFNGALIRAWGDEVPTDAEIWADVRDDSPVVRNPHEDLAALTAKIWRSIDFNNLAIVRHEGPMDRRVVLEMLHSFVDLPTQAQSEAPK